jgi:hypothetical protein
MPGPGLGCRFRPALHIGAKAVGEKDDRSDPNLVDSVHHSFGRVDIKGERLVHQEVTACSGGTDCQARLDVRREGDGYGIDRAQELVEVVIAL